MNWIGIVLLTAIVQCAISEIFSLFDVAARWLIRRASARLPNEARARYALEWEGEISAIPGLGLWRMLFAIRVRLGVAATARELGMIRERLPVKAQLGRISFMVVTFAVLVFLLPLTVTLSALIALIYGRPILRSRVVRARDGRRVTLHSFNVPGSTALGGFLDRTDLGALPSLVPMATGRIWPTYSELRIVVGDLLNGRPTQPFRDRGE